MRTSWRHRGSAHIWHDACAKLFVDSEVGSLVHWCGVHLGEDVHCMTNMGGSKCLHPRPCVERLIDVPITWRH